MSNPSTSSNPAPATTTTHSSTVHRQHTASKRHSAHVHPIHRAGRSGARLASHAHTHNHHHTASNAATANAIAAAVAAGLTSQPVRRSKSLVSHTNGNPRKNTSNASLASKTSARRDSVEHKDTPVGITSPRSPLAERPPTVPSPLNDAVRDRDGSGDLEVQVTEAEVTGPDVGQSTSGVVGQQTTGAGRTSSPGSLTRPPLRPGSRNSGSGSGSVPRRHSGLAGMTALTQIERRPSSAGSTSTTGTTGTDGGVRGSSPAAPVGSSGTQPSTAPSRSPKEIRNERVGSGGEIQYGVAGSGGSGGPLSTSSSGQLPPAARIGNASVKNLSELRATISSASLTALRARRHATNASTSSLRPLDDDDILANKFGIQIPSTGLQPKAKSTANLHDFRPQSVLRGFTLEEKGKGREMEESASAHLNGHQGGKAKSVYIEEPGEKRQQGPAANTVAGGFEQPAVNRQFKPPGPGPPSTAAPTVAPSATTTPAPSTTTTPAPPKRRFFLGGDGDGTDTEDEASPRSFSGRSHGARSYGGRTASTKPKSSVGTNRSEVVGRSSLGGDDGSVGGQGMQRVTQPSAGVVAQPTHVESPVDDDDDASSGWGTGSGDYTTESDSEAEPHTDGGGGGRSLPPAQQPDSLFSKRPTRSQEELANAQKRGSALSLLFKSGKMSMTGLTGLTSLTPMASPAAPVSSVTARPNVPSAQNDSRHRGQSAQRNQAETQRRAPPQDVEMDEDSGSEDEGESSDSQKEQRQQYQAAIDRRVAKDSARKDRSRSEDREDRRAGEQAQQLQPRPGHQRRTSSMQTVDPGALTSTNNVNAAAPPSALLTSAPGFAPATTVMTHLGAEPVRPSMPMQPAHFHLSSFGQPQPIESPRTTRRNMVATELPASLRTNLLHEREQRQFMFGHRIVRPPGFVPPGGGAAGTTTATVAQQGPGAVNVNGVIAQPNGGGAGVATANMKANGLAGENGHAGGRGGGVGVQAALSGPAAGVGAAAGVQRKKQAAQRMFTGDYHTSGW